MLSLMVPKTAPVFLVRTLLFVKLVENIKPTQFGATFRVSGNKWPFPTCHKTKLRDYVNKTLVTGIFMYFKAGIIN